MKDKKGNTTKIIIAIIAVVVVLLSALYIKNSNDFKVLGKVNISIVNIDGNTLKSKDCSFTKKDTLISVVKDNFDNVGFSESLLVSIDELETPADWSNYIAIYVNGNLSDQGIDEIVLKDGVSISFVESINDHK